MSREARSAAYGQEDHVRLYGNDFPDRLQAAGFRVTTIDASRFDGALVDRHVPSCIPRLSPVTPVVVLPEEDVAFMAATPA